jgi:hypothetical protein
MEKQQGPGPSPAAHTYSPRARERGRPEPGPLLQFQTQTVQPAPVFPPTISCPGRPQGDLVVQTLGRQEKRAMGLELETGVLFRRRWG